MSVCFERKREMGGGGGEKYEMLNAAVLDVEHLIYNHKSDIINIARQQKYIEKLTTPCTMAATLDN